MCTDDTTHPSQHIACSATSCGIYIYLTWIISAWSHKTACLLHYIVQRCAGGTAAYSVNVVLPSIQHSAQSSTLQNIKQFVLCRLPFLLRSLCSRASPTCWLPWWGEKTEEEKTKQKRTGSFTAPIPLQEFSAFDFFFFSITKGSFHCCQLNESLHVLHPFPAHHSLSLSLPLPASPAAAVSSPSFLCICLFKYSLLKILCISCSSSTLKERIISDRSCLLPSLSRGSRCALAMKGNVVLVDRFIISTVTLLKGIHFILNILRINQY